MYNLYVLYDDDFEKLEEVSSIVDAFSAAAIYAGDEGCIRILCIDNRTGAPVIDFHQ